MSLPNAKMRPYLPLLHQKWPAMEGPLEAWLAKRRDRGDRLAVCMLLGMGISTPSMQAEATKALEKYGIKAAPVPAEA